MTASKKKLALSYPQFLFSASVSHSADPSSSTSGMSGDRGEMTGYSIYNNQRLRSAISQVGVCRKCGGPFTLVESFSRRTDSVSKVSIECTRLSCKNSVVVSDPLTEEAATLNKRAILGVRKTGMGRAALANLCACMDLLPPISEWNWVKHNKEFGAG